MAIDLDGFAVLRALVKQPTAFPDISKEASRAAHALVSKQLTIKSANIGTVRQVYRAIGELHSDWCWMSLRTSKLKTLSNKIDKHNAELKAASSSYRRRHLNELAAGSVDPVSVPLKKPAKSKPRRLSERRKEL